MLINLLIVLIVVGVILYLLRYIPLDETVKTIIRALVIVALIIYLLLKVAAPLLESAGL